MSDCIFILVNLYTYARAADVPSVAVREVSQHI